MNNLNTEIETKQCEYAQSQNGLLLVCIVLRIPSVFLFLMRIRFLNLFPCKTVAAEDSLTD